ncbi:hypothetical protein PM082_024574 [Marasmius tenuissimus]|nr:hypothetical protein PM082_024574 [Marasmius tenuissimus]
MHRLFQVDELVHLILQWCGRKSNANNAIVCKSWSRDALSFLWEEITDINVVFALLGAESQINYQRYFVAPTAEKWSRFQSLYAPLVRTLDCSALDNAQQNRMIPLFDTLARLQSSKPIFPNLTTILWREVDVRGYSHHSVIFMHPNVKTFRFTLLTPDTITQDILSEYFLAVAERMPSLKIVEIQTNHGRHEILKGPLIALAKSLPLLSKLSLPSFLNIAEVMQQLSSCLNLRSIEFTRFDTQAGVTQMPPPISEEGFGDLQRLSIHTSYPTLAHFLRESSSAPRLSDLQVTSTSREGETPAGIKDLLEVVASRFEKTLRRLSVEIDKTFPPTQLSEPSALSIVDVVHFQHIEPILRCSNISRLTLTHSYPLAIEQDDLNKLAVAWPGLTHLRLCDDPQRSLPSNIMLKCPDLTGILPFSRFCPNLEVLALRLTPIIDVGFDVYGAPDQPLRHLHTFSPGNVPRDAINDVAVTMFLGLFLPPDCKILFVTNWGGTPGKPTVSQEWAIKWRDVKKGLVLVEAMKDRFKWKIAEAGSVMKKEK